ncbi:Rieske (2Fe-2S) protein [Neorhodopirellula pilleata]|uniref:Anthranilate 1,2-dioxygenase ferredoxin subunit n=1 Tax=Neorhodopirellula pilleata TaxID=2714738 RepID=A0A5C6ARX0_9BACT|nr:Rieske (2Fe-2S) protein [Neorhodopirellula pilleata]TWU01836.1 Anthranilate 1,2-dioxygenase ferredoxin subunit [Neorhodopirellula pilleata]
MQFETNSLQPTDDVPDGGEWHAVRQLAADDASESADLAFEALIGERVVAVFRHAGHWYAIDAMCAHQGGPLAQGSVRDGCVTCPWHGWQYDLATGIQTINRQPLQQTYPIRQNEDRVEVFV